MKETNKTIIGVVGGVGPYAGLDLAEKIFDQTCAEKDQDHLKVVLFSYPSDVPDRTEFLRGECPENPAGTLFEILQTMDGIGVTVAGIPCNTSHSEPIFSKIREKLNEVNSSIVLVNMVEAVADVIAHYQPAIKRVGVLCTSGTRLSDVYGQTLGKFGLHAIYPENYYQGLLHKAIYDHQYGIKAESRPVTDRAKAIINQVMEHVKEKKVDVIVLACTELPLAFDQDVSGAIPVIDTTLILARTLIQHVAPEKLRPLTSLPTTPGSST